MLCKPTLELMNIQELNKQTMTAMETLANTNVKIGEAKGILQKLQEIETTYLEEREKATVLKIDSILNESEHLLSKIHSNHEEINHFYSTTASFVGFLSEIQDKFLKTITSFNQKADQWEEYVKKTQSKIDLLNRDIKVQQQGIETDKKSIEKGLKAIENGKKVIESRQAQIASALAVLEQKQK